MCVIVVAHCYSGPFTDSTGSQHVVGLAWGFPKVLSSSTELARSLKLCLWPLPALRPALRAPWKRGWSPKELRWEHSCDAAAERAKSRCRVVSGIKQSGQAGVARTGGAPAVPAWRERKFHLTTPRQLSQKRRRPRASSQPRCLPQPCSPSRASLCSLQEGRPTPDVQCRLGAIRGATRMKGRSRSTKPSSRGERCCSWALPSQPHSPCQQALPGPLNSASSSSQARRRD